MTLPEFLTHFPGHKQAGSGYSARCPAHDDKKASLSIGAGENGAIVVKCHTGNGCPTEDIVKAAGLTMSDLYPDRSSQPPKRIDTIYQYRDEQEKLLFEAVRYTPKTFSQRRPDHRGGWHWNLQDTRRVLYRLPELLAADPAEWVFIVEGEKDVENLRALGLVATCNPCGAGKWKHVDPTCIPHLKNRRVCVIRDNDKAGKQHGCEVAFNLKGRVVTERILDLPDLPEKGDVSDWIESHDSIETAALRQRLITMAESAPQWEDVFKQQAEALKEQAEATSEEPPKPTFITAADLIAQNPDLNPPIIDGLLREAELLNLISSTKVGKSWLTLNLALSVVTGRAWLGRFPVKQGNVLLIDNELHAGTLANRIRRVAESMGVDPIQYGPALHVEVLRGRIQNLHNMRTYFEAIEPSRYVLVVLDAFYRFLPDNVEEHSNGGMAGLYNILDGHAQRLHSPFVLVHHASKGNQSEKSVTDVGSGAGSMSRATDTHLVLRPHEEDNAVAVEAAVRSFPPLAAFCLRWNFPLWESADDLDPLNLRKPKGRTKKADDAKPAKVVLTPEEFTVKYIGSDPREKPLIVGRACLAGLSTNKAEQLLTMAVSDGHAYRWVPHNKREPIRYATRAPDLITEEAPK